MTWLSSAKVDRWLCRYPSQETFSVEVPAGMDGSCSQILAFFQNLLIFQLKEQESNCSSKRCKQNPSCLLGVSEILLRSTFLEPRKVILNDVLIILLSKKKTDFDTFCFEQWQLDRLNYEDVKESCGNQAVETTPGSSSGSSCSCIVPWIEIRIASGLKH